MIPGGFGQATLVGPNPKRDWSAVGETGAGLSRVAFIERWDGATWTSQRPPTPTGFLANNGNSLSGVACPLSSLCVAVGGTLLGGADGSEAGLQGIWRGSRWATQPRPGLVAVGVSCFASTCLAVGGTGAGGAGVGSHKATAERLEGNRWTTLAPARASQFTVLSAVSCYAVSHCFAVGFGRVALIERYS